MTHTQQIIRDGELGGYDDIVHVSQSNGGQRRATLEERLIDPLFWQAVGKTRRWDKFVFAGKEEDYPEGSEYKAMRFFTSVMAGDDYETALSKLV